MNYLHMQSNYSVDVIYLQIPYVNGLMVRSPTLCWDALLGKSMQSDGETRHSSRGCSGRFVARKHWGLQSTRLNRLDA